MVSVISSSSAALKVLQAGAPQQAASARQEWSPIQGFLDPRSVLALSPQSFDSLLKMRAEFRRDHVQEQVVAPSQTSAPAATTKPSNLLGTFKLGYCISDADQWLEDMARLKAHSTEPLDSKFVPWNSTDVLQQLKDRDIHSQNFDRRDLETYMNDAAIYKSMADTPAEDAAEIRFRGGTIWYEYNHLHDRISDQEFYRNIKDYELYGETLRDPIDTSRPIVQAFLNGTAQIIRGSNLPELKYDSVNYISFAPNSEVGHYTQVGGWGRLTTNFDQVYKEYQKKNPTVNVSCIWAEDDVAIILYPKSNSTASTTTAVTAAVQSSATGTGTSPGATPAR